jgi:hypothetical protein
LDSHPAPKAISVAKPAHWPTLFTQDPIITLSGDVLNRYEKSGPSSQYTEDIGYALSIRGIDIRFIFNFTPSGNVTD